MRPLQFDPKQLNEEQTTVYQTILDGPRGEVVGPLKVWLKSPSLAMKAQDLGKFARYETSLTSVFSELAILITARIWSSGFEWSHHAPLAVAAGLEQHILDAISHAKIPVFNDNRGSGLNKHIPRLIMITKTIKDGNNLFTLLS